MVMVGTILGVFGVSFLLLRAFYNILWERAALWLRPMEPVVCSLYDKTFWDHERFWKLSNDPISRAVFSGTPIKNWLSRAQGMKIGKQVFDDGCGVSEPKLVTVGDYCNLNYHSALQSHSLEDGMFKADHIRVSDNCNLGVEAFVHYGVEIGTGAEVRTDAFVMKGSVIADGETWCGNPAEEMAPEQNFRRAA